MSMEERNPYEAPDAELAEPDPALPEEEAIRIGKFWGFVFALPCFAMAVFRIYGGNRAPVVGRWTFFGVVAVMAGWAYARCAFGRTLPRILAGAALIGPGAVILSAVIGWWSMVSHLHAIAGPGTQWRRVVLFLGTALAVEAVEFTVYFALLGAMVRWRIRAAARRESEA